MIVLDCCAALEIVQGTEKGKAFRALILEDEEIVVPSLYAVEITNAAWKFVHSGMLNKEEARQVMENALTLTDRIVDSSELLVEAFSQGISCNHSVYDMVYLILARRNDATLFTADKKLIKLCQENGVDCVMEVLAK